MKLACITLDVEPDWRSERWDIELFRDKEKLGLFKEVIDRYEVKLTGFLVTRLLQENAGLIEEVIPLLPIRFEVHSHTHNQYESDSEREIDESITWYERFFDRPPKGYRAPNGLISRRGIQRLAEKGFVYDSSIFPSFRFDEYGYNNLHLPIVPYMYVIQQRKLIELPMAVIPGIRLVLSLSYLKLLGLGAFKLLINIFGLPDVLVIDSHPYDFFIMNHLERGSGWKRWAHSRNAHNALNIFEGLLVTLKRLGYNFVYIDDLIERLDLKTMKRIGL